LERTVDLIATAYVHLLLNCRGAEPNVIINMNSISVAKKQ
jgi:hypothetical protein